MIPSCIGRAGIPFFINLSRTAIRIRLSVNMKSNPMCFPKSGTRSGWWVAHGTIDGTLRLVKAFLHWLAGQPGYKSRISYPDCEYFNNTRKSARIAHTAQPVAFPTMAQCAHAFQGMPNGTTFEKRDKALFAFLMLTGARISATASLRLRHINLAEGHVYQDAREVATKHAKTIDTWFFPVDEMYLECFKDWVAYLQKDLLFGPGDALFPKAEMGLAPSGGFQVMGLSREPYAQSTPLNAVIRKAFAQMQLPEFTPHSFRKTLVTYGDKICPDRRSFKAWSMNLGHESEITTVSSYLTVSKEAQRDLIRGM